MCCGAQAWCLGAGLCSLHEAGAGAGAAARKPGSPDGDLAALLEGTWELRLHWRLTVARIAIALCLLSSHLGCQMCPIMGQDSCVLVQLGHSSSTVQRGWVGVTTGEGHLPHSRLDAVLWHALPLDSGEGLSSSERAVYFVIEQIVHALS